MRLPAGSNQWQSLSSTDRLTSLRASGSEDEADTRTLIIDCTACIVQ
jgi:hypothetical protein